MNTPEIGAERGCGTAMAVIGRQFALERAPELPQSHIAESQGLGSLKTATYSALPLTGQRR
jgi:hypothetical protein